jgi:hypothetical protein
MLSQAVAGTSESCQNLVSHNARFLSHNSPPYASVMYSHCLVAVRYS